MPDSNVNSAVDGRIDNKLEEFDTGVPSQKVKKIANQRAKKIAEKQTEQAISNHIEEYHSGENTDENSDSGSGSGSTNTAVQEVLNEMKIIGMPDLVRTVPTGVPPKNLSYHTFPLWGQIVEVSRPIHFREAVVDAQDGGVLTVAVFKSDFDNFSLGDRHAAREIPIESGRQVVTPDIYLPPGEYFITREPISGSTAGSDTPNLRRVAKGVNWGDLNNQLRNRNMPIRFRTTWNPGFTTQDQWERLKSNDWHTLFHNYANMSFGYNTPSESVEESTEA